MICPGRDVYGRAAPEPALLGVGRLSLAVSAEVEGQSIGASSPRFPPPPGQSDPSIGRVRLPRFGGRADELAEAGTSDLLSRITFVPLPSPRARPLATFPLFLVAVLLCSPCLLFLSFFVPSFLPSFLPSSCLLAPRKKEKGKERKKKGKNQRVFAVGRCRI
jgi:hypothetical protein